LVGTIFLVVDDNDDKKKLFYICAQNIADP